MNGIECQAKQNIRSILQRLAGENSTARFFWRELKSGYRQYQDDTK